MVADEDVARELSARLLATYNELEQTVLVAVRGRTNAAEARRYKRATILVLTSLVTQLLDPLYARHPHLKPDGWDEPHDERVLPAGG